MTGRRERSTPVRAVVTGGAGFIGSHLVDRLVAERVDVLVVDDLSNGDPDQVAARARLERRDISTARLDRLFVAWRPAVVYHLAAQSSVPASVDDPLRDLAVNVVGTYRVAQAARAAGATRLVFTSSGGAVYGETRRLATERRRPAPSSPYGVHKLAAEGHVAIAGVDYRIARPGNVYGPRQRAGLEGAVVAAFVRQARSGSLVVHGDGHQSRDFVHVSDVVDALIRLGHDAPGRGIWNVASGRAVTVAELAAVVELAVGRPLVRIAAPARVGDVRHSSLSAERLARLGWQASVPLPSGVSQLVDAEVRTGRDG